VDGQASAGIDVDASSTGGEGASNKRRKSGNGETEALPCDVCGEPRADKNVYCQACKLNWEAMVSQAKKEKRGEQFLKAMSDPQEKTLAITNYNMDNPPNRKWRRRTPLDFTKFFRTHGKKDTNRHRRE
jgi:hypothetical protein